jgi:Helix-turn-helix
LAWILSPSFATGERAVSRLAVVSVVDSLEHHRTGCVRKVKIGKRTAKLLKELKKWCARERGLQLRVARVLKIDRQAINHWFAGRQAPTSEQILAVQEFLGPKMDDLRKALTTPLPPVPKALRKLTAVWQKEYP